MGVRVVERRHPLRFVWSMDAAGRFTIEPGDFLALAGAPTAAVQGAGWTDLAQSLGIDPAGEVVRAVAARDTWSGITVDWPLEDITERLPVILSGLPVLAPDRAFCGFRGFGVCRDVSRIAAAIAARHAALGGAGDGTPDAGGPQASAPPNDFSLPPACEPEEDGPAAGKEGRPRPTLIPNAPNVVPLRMNMPMEPRSALSTVERSAFQEIARALGARLESDTPPPPPLLPSTAETMADADGTAPDEPVTTAESATQDLAVALKAQLATATLPATNAPSGDQASELQTALAAAEARIRALDAARQDAEAASAAKSDFLAQLAHEIRTPLTAILGFSEAIMEERFGPLANERYQAYAKDIHASGEHIISLLNDLLDLAKIEAGMLDLTLAPVDLNEIVRGCVAMMQPQAGRERLFMRAALAPALPQVMGDARSLRQIALNLISNSVKFTGAGGQVIVSTAPTDTGDVVLRVRDTGIGMSANDIASALEPFRQVAGPHPQAAGTGLGLPLTKALAEANGGDFRITSEVSTGTLVEIVFRAARPVTA
jgi:signal transduction histidine kinase